MNSLSFRHLMVLLGIASTSACVSSETDPDADADITLSDESSALTLAELVNSSDRDHDLIPDLVDNCPDDANTDQFDADGEGVGNACDADYNNDGVVQGTDFAVFLAAFGSTRGDPAYDARADHAVGLGDAITGADYAVFLRYYGRPVPMTSVVPLETARVNDVMMMVGTGAADGAALRAYSPVSTVNRYPNQALESVSSLGGTLTQVGDGTLLLQRGFPCYDTVLVDPRVFSGNVLAVLSECSVPTFNHLSIVVAR